MRRILLGIAASALALGPWPAQAAVDHVEILSREPANKGTVYPGVGAYELIRGRAYFTEDPDAPANRAIVDLAGAPRNKDGKVEFAADFRLLRPVAPSRGTLIYDVANRGYGVAGKFDATWDAAGDGYGSFLERHGFSVLTSAWQWDVKPPEGAGDRPLVLAPPVAEDHGRPITGRVLNQFAVDKPSATASFVGILGRAYWPAVADDPEAVLTSRAKPGDPPRPIPRGSWRFAPSSDGDAPTKIELDGGFAPGRIYELVYAARDPYVVGLGPAGIRDLLSWFRTHPFEGAPEPKHVVLFGVSQTGRLITHMLRQGFDVDEQGRLAFDGAIAEVGGAGGGSFNHRFAFPTRASGFLEDAAYPTDLFPFTTATARDPATGRSASMLERARAADGSVPKVFFVEKSSEFWGRAASLFATTPDGRADVAPDANVRLYFLAGLQHFAGEDPARDSTVNCVNPQHDEPTLRALLVDLDDWIGGRAGPPANAYPSLEGGTLVEPARYGEFFPHGIGLTPPPEPHVAKRLDFGPRFETAGVVDRSPPEEGPPYGVLVPRPDRDGIDLGGWRPPEVAAPLGTYTGWNPRAASTGFAWALDRFQGSFQPFARTEAERRAASDPRPSLEARYGSRSGYLDALRAATAKAVTERWLLEEDVPAIVAAQAAFYDRVMAHDPHDQTCAYLVPPAAKP